MSNLIDSVFDTDLPDLAKAVELADDLLQGGISNPAIQRVVLGIKEYMHERGYCTKRQWDALRNIDKAIKNYVKGEVAFARFDSLPWDEDDEYFSEEVYGFND